MQFLERDTDTELIKIVIHTCRGVDNYDVPEFYFAAGAEGDGIRSAPITGLLISQIVLD